MSVSAIETDAFDFIDQLSGINTLDGLLSAFARRLDQFGLTNFLITGLPPPRAELEDHIVLSGWSQQWFDHYMHQHYYTDDPMARYTRSAIGPFRWSEVAWREGATDRSRRVMHEASEFGLNDGISVPIYGANGDQSCVTMGGRRIELPPHSREAIHLMSMYLHHRSRVLLEGDRGEARPRHDISKRELECLSWVSRGKTDWEVSRILNISEDTVSRHISNATKKLGSVNRTQAVAVALLERLIAP